MQMQSRREQCHERHGEHGARARIGSTYFSQHLGASSTKRSMVMSPSDVSSNTDIVCARMCCRNECGRELRGWEQRALICLVSSDANVHGRSCLMVVARLSTFTSRKSLSILLSNVLQHLHPINRTAWTNIVHMARTCRCIAECAETANISL